MRKKDFDEKKNKVVMFGFLILTALLLIFVFAIRGTGIINSNEDVQISSPIPTIAPTPSSTPKPTATPFKEFTGVITGNSVRFRAEPTEESGGEKSLYWGNTVQVVKEPDLWWEIKLDDEIGYVHSEYIKAVIESEKLDGEKVKNLALQYIGSKYKWGGETPEEGFDCSGFTLYVYGQFGITLNRIASDQALNGVEVPLEDIQAGDLILFKYYGKINHAGIYIGDEQVVHSANAASGVRVSPLSDFAGADLIVRRFVVKDG